MTLLDDVRTRAAELMGRHLPDGSWAFAFDNAKTRAGQCNYTARRITVSRYLASRYEDDEVHQVLLHEVAHALAGAGAGHGARWRSVAASLGYEGSRLHDGERADDLAPWVGVCPVGHRYYRHRRPTTRLSCSRCSRRFSSAHLIEWTRRDVAAARSRSRTSAPASA